MSSKVFLYRVKDSDDRDACAYIEKPGRFECGHYFGHIGLQGSCYSGGGWVDYNEIETVLTRDEYRKLQDYNAAISLLGYGIEKDSERYQLGIGLTKLVMPIWDKLNSDEAEIFWSEIKLDEDQRLMDEYGLDEDDLETIWSNYGLDYHDRSVVGCTFRDVEDLGYEEAYSLGYLKSGDSIMDRYFDYEAFGKDLLRDDERYVELGDGRIVCLSY